MWSDRTLRSSAKKTPQNLPKLTLPLQSQPVVQDIESLQKELYDFNGESLGQLLSEGREHYVEGVSGECPPDDSTLPIITERDPKKSLDFGKSSGAVPKRKMATPDPSGSELDPTSSDSDPDSELDQVSDKTFKVDINPALRDPKLETFVFDLPRSISCAGPPNALWKDVYPRSVSMKAGKVTMGYRRQAKPEASSSTTGLETGSSNPRKTTPEPTMDSRSSDAGTNIDVPRQSSSSRRDLHVAGPSKKSEPVKLASNSSGDLYFLVPYVDYPTRTRRFFVPGAYVDKHPELVEDIPSLLEGYLRSIGQFTFIDGQYDLTKAAPM